MKILVFVLLTFLTSGLFSQISPGSIPDCQAAGDFSGLSSDQIVACYNPLTDAITIELKDKKTPDEQIHIELYSVLGLSVFDKLYAKPTLVEIPVKNFKKGMYIIVVSDGKNTVKKRLLIN